MSDLMKLEFSGQTFQKSLNMKFHAILSSRSQDVPCGQMDGQRHDIAFHSCANALKN